jgi:hypothetical protein
MSRKLEPLETTRRDAFFASASASFFASFFEALTVSVTS